MNQDELSIDLIEGVAKTFQTSFVSAALRAAEVSHFIGAVVAIRDGAIAWSRRSDPLIERGIYSGEKGPVRSSAGSSAWRAYTEGDSVIPTAASWARDWFRIYDEDRRARLPVTESYLPVRVMDTLIVVLPIPEDD